MKLQAHCPSCGTLFAGMPLMKAATTVHRRVCRKCRERWQLTVRPMGALKTGVGWKHVVDLTFLARLPKKA